MKKNCERCADSFDAKGFQKRCPTCRVTCAQCSQKVTDRQNLCTKCRPARRRMVKCGEAGCNTQIRYNKNRGGVCASHTDWNQHATRLAAFNVATKSKPDHLKYKSERIASVSATCIICEQAFLAKPGNVKRGGGQICSPICHGIRAAKLTPKKSTNIERAIEAELIKAGLCYEPQKALIGQTIADFYLPDSNAVVYCDGKYWHSRPEAIKRDARQNEALALNGFKVFRFTEAEIHSSPAECVRRLMNG